MSYDVEEAKEKKTRTELAKDAIKKAGEKQISSTTPDRPIIPGPSTHSIEQTKKKKE
jgi:hypothetical protein